VNPGILSRLLRRNPTPALIRQPYVRQWYTAGAYGMSEAQPRKVDVARADAIDRAFGGLAYVVSGARWSGHAEYLCRPEPGATINGLKARREVIEQALWQRVQIAQSGTHVVVMVTEEL